MKNFTKAALITIVLLIPMEVSQVFNEHMVEAEYPTKPSRCILDLDLDPLSNTFKRYLFWLENEYDLPEGLLFIVMMKESSGNSNAISSAGAEGLFQFMPNTSNWLQIDPFHPYQAALGAARYLQYLIDYFSGNIELGLAAYNAGMGNVRKYGNTIPPFQETQEYVAYITYRMTS